MKKFSFKAVALAAGLLAGGSAFATVDLDATGNNPIGTVLLASESTIDADAGTALTDDAAYNATVALGSAIPDATTRFVRVTLSSGTFTANPALSLTNGTVTLLQGGAGESYALFSVLTTAALASNATVTFNPAGITVKNKDAVSLTYGLYETQSQAANQLQPLKTASKAYAKFVAALKTTVTAKTVTADVDASPSFTKFTGNAATKVLADFTVAVTADAPITVGAAAANANNVLSKAALTLNGDFTAAKNDDGTYTGNALDRVFIAPNDDCTGTKVSATSLTASKAVFADISGNSLNTDGTRFVCLTAEGSPEIPVGTYTLDTDYTAATNFAVSDITGSAAGTIERNGVTLVAPLVNQPGGWYSRLVLSNTSSVARPYAVTAVTETGSTVTLTGDALSGSLPANSTKVIDLAALATVTGGAPRASLKVVVNGPTAHISGLYQLANGVTGMISNYTLVQK